MSNKTIPLMWEEHSTGTSSEHCVGHKSIFKSDVKISQEKEISDDFSLIVFIKKINDITELSPCGLTFSIRFHNFVIFSISSVKCNQILFSKFIKYLFQKYPYLRRKIKQAVQFYVARTQIIRRLAGKVLLANLRCYDTSTNSSAETKTCNDFTNQLKHPFLIENNNQGCNSDVSSLKGTPQTQEINKEIYVKMK